MRSTGDDTTLKRLSLDSVSIAALNYGCVTTSNDYCDIAKPIRWQTVDELDATPMPVVRQIVVHNETWRAVCK